MSLAFRTVYVVWSPAAPDDYGAVQNLSLMFQIGFAINTSLCVDVDIFDDVIVEYFEDFSVSLASDDPVIFAPISEANVSIYDNDRKLLKALST